MRSLGLLQIYHEVLRWYRETYGPAFEREDSRSTATGIVLVRGLPVELRVPLTRHWMPLSIRLIQ